MKSDKKMQELARQAFGVEMPDEVRREHLDPTPVEWPIGVNVPETLEQKMARMIRTSVSMAARDAGAETFEEADDFDVEDSEALPESQHELDDDQEQIMRDQAAVRRIPRQFREAYERERARLSAEREKQLAAEQQKQQKPEDGTVAPT